MAFGSLSSGAWVTPMVLSVRYAGLLEGVINGFGNAAGIVAPLLTGVLLDGGECPRDDAPKQPISSSCHRAWLLVFFLAARHTQTRPGLCPQSLPHPPPAPATSLAPLPLHSPVCRSFFLTGLAAFLLFGSSEPLGLPDDDAPSTNATTSTAPSRGEQGGGRARAGRNGGVA